MPNEFIIKNGFFSQGNSSVTGDLSVSGTSRIQNKLSVGTPTESSAIMEVTSTSQGLLIPRMTSTQKNAISSPAVGLMVFDTDNGLTEIYDSFWGWMPIANQNDWMRRWGMEYWNDFGVNNSFSDGVFTTFATNAGGQGVASLPLPADLNYIGFQGLRTGVNTNGGAQLRTDVNVGRYMVFGYGQMQFETRIYIRTLSNSTDRFTVAATVSNNSVTTTITNGCAFIYDEGGVGTGTLASPNWQIITAAGGVRTVFDTSIVVSATTFYSFRIDINSSATEIKYYINNTLVRTETTNIPPQGLTGTLPSVAISKVTGTTDIGILVDYIGLKKKFIIPR